MYCNLCLIFQHYNMYTCAKFESETKLKKDAAFSAIDTAQAMAAATAKELFTKRTSNFLVVTCALSGSGLLFLIIGMIVGNSAATIVACSIFILLGTVALLAGIGFFCCWCWRREQDDDYVQAAYFNKELRQKSNAKSFEEHFSQKRNAANEMFIADTQMLKDARATWGASEFKAADKKALKEILDNCLNGVRKANKRHEEDDKIQNAAASEEYKRKCDNIDEQRKEIKAHNKPIKKEIRLKKIELAKLRAELHMLDPRWRRPHWRGPGHWGHSIRVMFLRDEIYRLESRISSLRCQKKSMPSPPIRPAVRKTPPEPETPLVQAIRDIDDLKTLADLAINRRPLETMAQDYGIDSGVNAFLSGVLDVSSGECAQAP
jgi:hypothetical protein